jgi:hypothetical protein
VLGFGFVVNAKSFSVGVGHLRGSNPSGHVGFFAKKTAK